MRIMRNKSIFMILSVFWVSSMLFTSCKDIDLTGISSEVMIDESLIAPVGEASVTVDDLLLKMDDPTRIHTEGTEIFITYEDSVDYKFREIDVTKFTGNVNFEFAPWSSSSSATLPAGTNIPISPVTNSINLGLQANSSEQIVKAEISTATLGLNLILSPDIKNKVSSTITVRFPNNGITKRDGTPFIISLIPDASGVASSTLKDFIMSIPPGSNAIPVEVTIDAMATSDVNVSSSSKFTCDINFKLQDYKVLWGNFQPATTSKDLSKIALDLPTSLSGLNLKFANPTVTLTIKSNIGAALLFNVDYVRALDKNDATIASAFFTGPDSYNNGDSRVFRLTKPKNPGEWATTAPPIVLDKDNGATNRLFESGKIPAALEYQFSSGVAADPELSFLVPDAGIKAHVDVKVPLQLNAGSTVEMTDSIKDIGVNLTSSMKDITINTGTLILNITNSFPTAATVELINMKDVQGNEILKSLTKVYSIDAPAEVSADGSVTKTKIQQLQIELKDGQFDEFKKLKDLVFKITLGDKTSTKTMHFSKANFIKVKAGVFVKGTITGNIGTTKN